LKLSAASRGKSSVLEEQYNLSIRLHYPSRKRRCYG
jgi:hypothetical protein